VWALTLQGMRQRTLFVAGLADECEVAAPVIRIGLARPVSIQVETFGTGKISDEAIAALVEQHFDFRLAAIVKQIPAFAICPL